MRETDRQMLTRVEERTIRVDENMLILKEAFPKLAKKVSRHEKLFLAVFVGAIVYIGHLQGGLSLLKGLFF